MVLCNQEIHLEQMVDQVEAVEQVHLVQIFQEELAILLLLVHLKVNQEAQENIVEVIGF